ncbi:MAG TPA: hypothetical protein VG963_17560, partial [Polyangiaceae bacterium]|nr:hypothetical protein [Polyangiaceae bacterium]
MTGSSGHFFDIKFFEHLQPRTLVLVIGTLAAAVNIFFGPSLDDTFVLLLVPAAIMAVVLLGGWLAGIICGAVSMLAGLVQGSDLYQIGVHAVVAIVGGEMLRRGVKPMTIALLHTVCNAGVNWRLLGGPVSVSVEEITAAALVVSCVNVTAATAVLTVMPRRSAMFPPRCRVRWDHIVFVLTPG